MKLRLLGLVLLLVAVPEWAAEGPEPATASPEPSTVEATVCLTFNGAPMTSAEVAVAPFLRASEMMTPTRVPGCLACREFVPTCKSPGQDAGKACGDGDPPNTCTCQWCDHTFGCFP